MAFPTHVNDQITDSITQANTKVLGDAPQIEMGNLYQATEQALSDAARNAADARAVTAMGVATLDARDAPRPAAPTKRARKGTR